MTIHNIEENIYEAEKALELLKAGNERFVNQTNIERNNFQDRAKLLEGQQPFATVLTCSDSRVAPEILFDQGLGDIFIVRNAGNVASDEALGSIEYAAGSLKTPLIVVLGHSSCGAVAASIGDGELSEKLATIIDRIKLNTNHHKDTAKAGLINVEKTVEEVENNPVVKENKTRVIGAYYDLETGKVEFFE